MRLASRWSAIVAVSFVVMTGTGQAATEERIGGWVLRCPDGAAGSGGCLMRVNKRLFEKAGITGDLEVQAQGQFLVPVVALRGLSNDMLMAAAAAGGKAAASIQFAGAPPQDLNCAPSSAGYFCSPSEAAAKKLAMGLPAARSATIRVSVSVPGMNPLPAQERSVDLSSTTEALSRLRMVGPSTVPNPVTALGSQSPTALMDMADKALKAAGYLNGVAGIQAMVTKHLKTR
jgi:hypothetical protein